MTKPEHDAARQAAKRELSDEELRERHRENQKIYFKNRSLSEKKQLCKK